MNASSIFILVLIVTSGLLFTHRLIYLVRLAGLGQGTLQLDKKAERFKNLFVNGVGQHLILKRPSGIGHFFIFWGFFFLSFGAVEGLFSTVFTDFSFAFLGPFYLFVNSGQDILGFLVISALMISLFRRLVIRPRRLEGPMSHTVDALVIVAFILLLTLMFYGLNIGEPKPGWTPVTDILRTLLPSGIVGSASSGTLYEALVWSHNGLFLVFLVYILYSKHSHIFFALPNIFLREDRHPGVIDKLDLENEGVERFGAQYINDFSKKDLLDFFACSECGRCQESCPAFCTGKSLSPKSVIQDLKKHLISVGPGLLQEHKSAGNEQLYSSVIAGDSLWACTTCRACDEACPVENSPMNKIIEIRQACVLMGGDFPEEAKNALRNMETQSNPWGFPQEQRGQWADGLGIKTLSEDSEVEYLYFVGCAGSYDQRYISVSRALVKILQEAEIKFGILGNEEMCSGDSAKRIGNDYLAQELVNANVSTMNRYGVKKIITACPHCYNTLKNEYPQYGGDYEVFHHSEFISNLIENGKLRLRKQDGIPPQKVTFHDSCYLGRYNRIIEKPREILAQLDGLDRVELKRNREESFCCGAGGGRMWMEEKKGVPINVSRSQEIIGSGANAVATACPFCMSMLRDGLKHENEAEKIQVVDIAEIVAGQMKMD